MTSTTSNQSPAINFTVVPPSNETGYDFPLSPSEPGKFDFYRVHLTNQAHRKDSIFTDQHETNLSSEIPNSTRRWTPFANIKDQSKESPLTSSSSSVSLFPTKKSATDSDLLPSNKPIQTVASFSSLTDAVKNAMQRGTLSAGVNPLRRPASGSTLSTKDLNHLSPQSM